MRATATPLGDIISYFFWGCRLPRSAAPAAIARCLLGITAVHTRLRSLHMLQAIRACGAPQAPVLEVGFGDGVLLRHLSLENPAVQHEGWEADGASLVKAQSRIEGGGPCTIRFLVKRFEEYTGAAEFGLVYCVDVLEHIPDDLAFVKTMYRALEPGGCFLVHVPRRARLQRRFFKRFAEHGEPGHVREEYTPEELSGLLTAGGFELVELRETFGPCGELAFEVNSFAWRTRGLDALVRIITLPLVLPLGLLDMAGALRPWGNSLLAIARKPGKAAAP